MENPIDLICRKGDKGIHGSDDEYQNHKGNVQRIFLTLSKLTPIYILSIKNKNRLT